MALTLEQYATWLDSRDLPWPAPPTIERPKARPCLSHLPEVRAVLWNVYGTLLAISGGELYFEHPQKFVMEVALDKTVQEFKMWASMARTPEKPTDYLARSYAALLSDQRMAPSGAEKYPEISADRLWEGFVKKLLQKEYRIDAGFYGALNEFSRKVAYFFHASLQTPVAYPDAALAMQHVHDNRFLQGLLADGQCFTTVQLQRCLAKQAPKAEIDTLADADLRFLSFEFKAKKPSERFFKQALDKLAERGIEPDQVLHVGSRIDRDIVPAKRLGMRTALFAGDKASLGATAEQLKDPASRPDVLLTELNQLVAVVG